jgi:hypothetical protein
MAPSLRAECVSAILVALDAVSIYRCCVALRDTSCSAEDKAPSNTEKRCRGLIFGAKEGPDPVEHQLGSLLDDPVANAVDELDLEIADAIAVRVE